MRVIRKGRIQASLAFTSLALALLLGLTAVEAIAQEGATTFSQNVPEQTTTFATVNPYTQASGSMTITFRGVFHVTRGNEPTALELSNITGGQRGTFTFVPDDSSQPTISGRFRFTLTGKRHPKSDTITFAFRMDGMAPDGSVVTFVQTESAVVTEQGFDISFGKTDQVGVAKNN